MTLAEVEVMSGGKNIAPAGKASQSSVSSGGDPARAIDGKTSGGYGDDTSTHTSDRDEKTWWEVDLGAEKNISKVRIYNRTDNELGKRLDGFTFKALNAKRKVVVERAGITAPQDSVSLEVGNKANPTYLDTEAKKVDANDWKADRSEKVELAGRPAVEVPADYKDAAPFAFAKGDTVALIGNALGERFQYDGGGIETFVQNILPDHGLSFRNMSASGDRVDNFPRSKGFTPMDAYLQHVGADVIFCFFGYNESFDDKPSEYQKSLVNYVAKLRSYQPNGESFPRIVLFSPIAHENLRSVNPSLSNGKANNGRLAKYTEATRAAAEEAGVAFVELFAASQALYAEHKQPLTINGIHLNRDGNFAVGRHIAEQLTGSKAGDATDVITKAIEEKNWAWYNRYRATDGNDVWGSRSGLKFVNDQTNAEVLQHELVMLDAMAGNLDHVIWGAAQGKPLEVDPLANVPTPIPVISNVGGGSRSSSAEKEGSLEYLNAEGTISKMTIPEGFKVECFADHETFPELINPVQMQVDSKGRLWVACWPTYPKWEPGKPMHDCLLILEDTDGDGKADKRTNFAEVHNPVGFEFWNGGVLVTSQPDLVFLRDNDGDDVADERFNILGGFGSSDTHHTANNLIMGPDGGIYWQSGVFLQHNHENPWTASLRTTASAMFRFDPRRFTVAFHANNSPNPHGISFDDWGYHYANDGTGGRSYQVRPNETGFGMHPLVTKEVRPVPADAIVSSSNFPEEMQGNFLVCNAIGFLGIKNYKLHRDGYSRVEKVNNKDKKTGKTTVTEETIDYAVGEVWGTPEEELLSCTDGNFRPTDAVFGADGALYIADWQNVIIGHMQHNVRDPNRDKSHGRVYRMVYTGNDLQEEVAIDGVSEADLMKVLAHPVDSVRHRARVEISERDTDAVIAAAKAWIAELDPKSEDDAHHLLEALWVHQQHNVRNRELLDTVLASPVDHARIAAATVKHHWDVADPAKGLQEIHEEEEMKIIPGGLVSDTDDLTTFRVNTIVEQMKYDVAELEVKAGKAMKIIFVNPDALPHNLVLCKPGTADAVAAAAIAMGAEGFKAGFLPESADILHHTELLDGEETEELEFTAPTEPGDYPYICTFPGHATLMRGVLKVK